MYKNNHPSVKQQIADSFMELMTKKFYMDITIAELVNHAQVARISFYRNFSSISDVIDYVIDELSTEFVTDILPVLSSRDDRKWRAFLFEYFYRLTSNQKRFTDIGFQNTSVFFSRMDIRMQQYKEQFSAKTIDDKYTPFGKMGLINNIAKEWMNGGMKETPEELINYIMTFITLF